MIGKICDIPKKIFTKTINGRRDYNNGTKYHHYCFFITLFMEVKSNTNFWFGPGAGDAY